jgi:hypothetical protein
MKKIMNFISSGILMLALIANVAFAQEQQPSQSQSQSQSQQSGQQGQQQEPKTLTDRTMSQRMSADLGNRNAKVGNNPVSWYDAGYGYYGTYTIDSTKYMTLYDRKGNYMQTLTKKEWGNSQIPSSVTTAFNQSPYKDQTVDGYWEVSDFGKKGYYMELTDKQGKKSRVWMNDQGKISNSPESNNNNVRPNK